MSVAGIEPSDERRIVREALTSANVFGTLAPDLEAHLLDAAVLRDVAAGEMIVREGEAGYECFAIVAGEVDVLDHDGVSLARLEAGAIFGETALLTHEPRNASVVAATACRLVVVPAEAFDAVMRENGDAQTRLARLVQVRDRPQRQPGIELHERVEGGAPGGILKDPARSAYFHLSADGLAVWRQLDGRTTMRDVIMGHFLATGTLAPERVMRIVADLRSAGFLCPLALESPTRSRADSLTDRMRAILTAHRDFTHVDAAFGALYRIVGRRLFTRSGALLVGLMSLAGFAGFFALAPWAIAQLAHANVLVVMLFSVPAYFVLIVCHESGHALAVKAVGRTIPRAGIGWYWFGPVAFVDTSDSWLATRPQRILVTAAGLIANTVVAAGSIAVAFVVHEPAVRLAAWQFALFAYLNIVENLNPLLELDGYYLLVDALDRPTLRNSSLRWLGAELPAILRSGRVRALGRLECAYGVTAILYIAAIAVQGGYAWHTMLHRWLTGHLPVLAIDALALVIPVSALVLAIGALLGEIRNAARAPA